MRKAAMTIGLAMMILLTVGSQIAMAETYEVSQVGDFSRHDDVLMWDETVTPVHSEPASIEVKGGSGYIDIEETGSLKMEWWAHQAYQDTVYIDIYYTDSENDKENRIQFQIFPSDSKTYVSMTDYYKGEENDHGKQVDINSQGVWCHWTMKIEPKGISGKGLTLTAQTDTSEKITVFNEVSIQSGEGDSLQERQFDHVKFRGYASDDEIYLDDIKVTTIYREDSNPLPLDLNYTGTILALGIGFIALIFWMSPSRRWSRSTKRHNAKLIRDLKKKTK